MNNNTHSLINVLKVLTDEPRAFHIVHKGGFPLIFGYFLLSKKQIDLWLFFQHKGSPEVSINTILDKQLKNISA